MTAQRIVGFLLIVLATVTATSAICYAAGDLSVEVTLDRDTIGLDEQATLQVIVSGAEQNLPDPQLPPLPMFEAYSQGRSSNISIVNGRMSASATHRFILLPTKPGTFLIEQIAVVYGNRRYVGNPVEVTVLARGSATSPRIEERALERPGQRRDYFMEAVVDNRNPYVNQQVTLTLKFYTAVQYYGSPELTEPPTTGFWTEVLGNKAPYQQRINNRVYKVIERKYALFPTQTGELTIGRGSIRFTVAARDKRRNDPFNFFGEFFATGQEVAVQSAPITINVKPLPEAGRPDDFTGSIGSFKMTAAADKTAVELNQPVSVTIRINGTGNVKSVSEPTIPTSDDFRVYRASTSENISKLNDRLGGTKLYEEVFIPRRPGTLRIPALRFSYFDPERGRYEALATQPIVVNVVKPEGYAASADIPYSAPDLTIGSRASDIRYIKQDLGDTTPMGKVLLFTPLYIAVNGLPVLVLAATVLIRRRRERLTADIGYARSRKASKTARRKLARAKSRARVEHAGEFFAEVASALTSYIADKLNVSPHGLTSDRIAALLRERSADEILIREVDELLRTCDFARYAPAAIAQAEIDAALARAEQTMTRMEEVNFA